MNLNANPNLPNLQGDTPIHLFLSTNIAFSPQEPEQSKEILNILAESNIDLSLQNNEGNTPLHLCSASKTQLEWLIEQINSKEILSVKNKEDLNAIEYATQKGDVERVVNLWNVYKKFEIPLRLVNIIDNNSNSILHSIASSEEFGYLISQFIDEFKENDKIDLQNVNGDSALHIAIRCDNVEVVEKLIQSGSSLQLKNNNDQSPIEIALCNVSVGSIYHILSYDEKAISNDQLMNVRHQSGSYLVHRAIEIGHWKLVKKLIDLGVDLNVTMISEDGFEDDGSPLHFAARTNNAHILDLLLSVSSLNINSTQNYNKNTPLHIACNNGSIECISLLCRHQMISNSFDITNIDGQTPLDCVYESGSSDCISILQHAIECKKILQSLKNENSPRILILGGGFVGSRLSNLFNLFGFQVYQTHRSLSNRNNSNSSITLIEFDLENEETWKNLPDNLDWCIITMALKNPAETEKFYNDFLSKNVSKIIVYGSTSRFNINQPHVVCFKF